MIAGLRFAAGVLFALAYEYERKQTEFSTCECRKNLLCQRMADESFARAMMYAARAYACLDAAQAHVDYIFDH